MVKIKPFYFVLFFLLVLSSARAESQSVDSNCQVICNNSADIFCSISGLGEQITCQFSKTFSEQANTATDKVINVTYGIVVSNPPIQDSTPIKDAQVGVVSVVFVIFILVMIWAGFEFIFSGTTSFVSRSAAKQSFQKAVLGLLLVFLSSSIYFLILDVFGVIADALKPGVAEIQSLNGVLLNPFGGFLFSFVLALFMVVVLIVLMIRWVLVIAGFFLFPFAILFEAVSFTRGFGESLNRLILGNFVIQVIDIILLRTAGIIVANSTSLLQGFDTLTSFAAVLAILVLLVVINVKFYFGQVASMAANATVYRSVSMAMSPSSGFPKAFSK